MNIIQQAGDFVQRLLHPNDPRRCPHCGKRMTKKNGTRQVTIRDLNSQGAQPERHQNWWCHLCKKPYYVEDPRRAKYAHYTRQVQRKGLDMYFHLGGSLRGVSQWLRSEINGDERASIWNPLAQQVPPAQQPARLHHTTLWRWEQKAGQRAAQHRRQGLWQGLLNFSGGLVADGTAVSVRGVQVPIHLICDGLSRVGMRIQRLIKESEVTIRGQFYALLRNWGLTVEAVKVLVSDGAAWYQAALDWVLRKARQQRSLFHLWRNILPAIRTYGAEAGEEKAKQFTAEVKNVWNAVSLAAAREELVSLRKEWGTVALLQEALNLIARTLEEAMVHTEGIVPGLGRTSNVAERFFRRYKQRLARMGCFMSFDGCDNFNDLWQVYINCEPYQVRKEQKKVYRYPGQCPLEVGGMNLQQLTWLDIVGV